ncbi:MAG: alpha/beta fold hydrolase [Chloroflexota bacterium]
MTTGINEKVTTVNDLTVHYYEAGRPENKPVMLLHGHVGDAWMHWSEAMPMLAETYYVIAPDMPGYGQSDRLPRMTPETITTWVIGLMQAVGMADAVLIGNSFSGGLAARLTAAVYPDRVPALILINGGTIPDVPGCAKIIAGTPGIGPFFYKRLAASTTSHDNMTGLFEDKDRLTDAVMSRIRNERDGLAHMMRTLSAMPKPDQRTPPIPVLLIWGEEDAITPRVIGEAIHKAIPGAKLELIANTRHIPHVEEPEVFAWQVKRFLDEIAQPGDLEIP